MPDSPSAAAGGGTTCRLVAFAGASLGTLLELMPLFHHEHTSRSSLYFF